ncbi:hypothetical protein TNCV_3504891 [Trichonephila clavipes]|uniref:Uncharacterized protein n=1 Tax=Trichonephila clavipes TaxID=2585209 RepID=A0A8X6RWW7_TRICX|nr:hypothetical protein TNCV_3504891 [Trichonephila clavipes]
MIGLLNAAIGEYYSHYSTRGHSKSRGPSETIGWQDNCTSHNCERHSCLASQWSQTVLSISSAPLDIQRNERLVFETLSSGDVKCSIGKGTEEDKFGLIQIAKKAERRVQMKKKKAHTVKNTPIVYTRTDETVNALLHRPFESLQWSMAPNEVERSPPYTMMKAFKPNSTSFGFLKISPFSTKTQYSPLEKLHSVLLKGHLEVVT